jgi:hypothetical protein
LEDMSYREIADIAGAPACTAALHPVRAHARVAAARNGAWMRPSKEMLP